MTVTIQEGTKPEAFFLRRLVQMREDLRAALVSLEKEAEAEFLKLLVRAAKDSGVTISRDSKISSSYGHSESMHDDPAVIARAALAGAKT